jgi:hypothetical protein
LAISFPFCPFLFELLYFFGYFSGVEGSYCPASQEEKKAKHYDFGYRSCGNFFHPHKGAEGIKKYKKYEEQEMKK